LESLASRFPARLLLPAAPGKIDYYFYLFIFYFNIYFFIFFFFKQTNKQLIDNTPKEVKVINNAMIIRGRNFFSL